MTKDYMITCRLTYEDAVQLDKIIYALQEPTISETIRVMIGREYVALSKAGLIK